MPARTELRQTGGTLPSAAGGSQNGALNTGAVIGVAFFLGIALARWLDWMDRARAGV